jgi:hypothetical protein
MFHVDYAKAAAAQKKRLTLFDGVSRGLWCPIRDPLEKWMGSVCAGKIKIAFPSLHRKNNLEKRVVREGVVQRPCLAADSAEKASNAFWAYSSPPA